MPVAGPERRLGQPLRPACVPAQLESPTLPLTTAPPEAPPQHRPSQVNPRSLAALPGCSRGSQPPFYFFFCPRSSSLPSTGPWGRLAQSCRTVTATITLRNARRPSTLLVLRSPTVLAMAPPTPTIPTWYHLLPAIPQPLPAVTQRRRTCQVYLRQPGLMRSPKTPVPGLPLETAAARDDRP